jgi:PIN domain nuclease of toxin-antitoxin system
LDLLLDTHVFLWWDLGDARLGATARADIADPANRIFVSAASVWEIAIKSARGKLVFSGSPAAAIDSNGFVPLAISPAHAEVAGSLDWSHADPFDRMLVAQSLALPAVLVHADQAIRTHAAVTQLWAS